MKFQIALLVAALLLWSCSGSESPDKSETQIENPAEQSFVMVEIDQAGFTLHLPVPNDYYSSDEITIEMNEAFGQLEVSSGVFNVEISEEQSDKAMLLSDLKRDLVFDFEILEDSEIGKLYRQFIRDTDKEFWHFYISIEHNNREYVVKDAGMSQLNEYQARKIFNAFSESYSGSNPSTL